MFGCDTSSTLCLLDQYPFNHNLYSAIRKWNSWIQGWNWPSKPQANLIKVCIILENGSDSTMATALWVGTLFRLNPELKKNVDLFSCYNFPISEAIFIKLKTIMCSRLGLIFDGYIMGDKPCIFFIKNSTFFLFWIYIIPLYQKKILKKDNPSVMYWRSSN